MFVLGINDGHDAGVALLKDGQVLFASNEERFSRKKMHSGFPHLSLAALLYETGVDKSRIGHIAFGGYGPVFVPMDYKFENEKQISFLRKMYSAFAKSGVFRMDGRFIVNAHRIFAKSQRFLKIRNSSINEVKRVGINCTYTCLDHHLCHAASAYYTSGFSDATIITLDGGGDGLSGTIYKGSQGKLVKINHTPKIHSAGNFWDYITYICGFKPSRHGGKITGLAAYEPCQDVYNILSDFYSVSTKEMRWENKRQIFWSGAVQVLKKELKQFNIRQIAWGAQKLLEKITAEIVKEAIKKTGVRDLSLAGGVFANVRLNQKLNELSEVNDIFIHPHMGDGGLALGAAYAALTDVRTRFVREVYWGTSISDEQVEKASKKFGVKAVKVDNPELLAAELINDKKIVGLVRGRAEYGPRALCNRSILAHPTDPSINDWLNKRFERSEFMPFAPVIIEEFASDYFKRINEHGQKAARFMTICFETTSMCRKKAPAIVHVDGTARPQLVSKDTNPFIYKLLKHYHNISGLPLCVNTSFNRHEEPIVNTAEDAIRELKEGRVDNLLINDFHIMTD